MGELVGPILIGCMPMVPLLALYQWYLFVHTEQFGVVFKELAFLLRPELDVQKNMDYIKTQLFGNQ